MANQTVTITLPATTITQNSGETYITTVTTTITHILPIDNIMTSPATNDDDVIMIDINQLIDEYNENEVAADLKYKNKRLQITDTIDSISSSSSGPLINFSTRLVWSVYCYFGNTYAPQIAQFCTGQIITIQGICMGKGYLGVILKDCMLIS
jgi:hypothetical protein